MDNNKGSLTKKLRPAFIIKTHNNKGVYIVPLTSVEKPYHQQNPFAVKLGSKGYAMCDQYEKVAITDKRILGKVALQLTEEDKLNIALTLEKYTSLVINKNLKMDVDLVTDINFNVGDKICFTEELKEGMREITGIIAAVDSSISKEQGDDYILLHVQSVKGKQKDDIYKHRTALIRTRSDLGKGITLHNAKQLTSTLDVSL